MSKVAILLDIEEGHYLATFQLAKGLRARGHTICYLGLAGAEPLVRQQGFDFVPMFGETLPGSRLANLASTSSFDVTRALVDGALDRLVERVRPDVLIMLSLFYLSALIIECRYRLPVVLLTPSYRSETRLRNAEKKIRARLLGISPEVAQKVLALIGGRGTNPRSFQDLARLVLTIPELVLLPAAFDLPELAADPHVTYVGAGVDLTRAEEPFPWETLDPRLPLVVCSLGSQADLASASERPRRFFRCVIEAAAARPDLQFILSLGRGFSRSEFEARSPNLLITEWIPQLTVLGKASLMVNHGGIGTVKECILKGVPMVTLPLMRDQFDCARRVVHHGLGVEGDLEHLTCGALLTLIDTVAGDHGFRRSVETMRERFLNDNTASLGVRLIEAAIARGASGQTSNRRPSVAPRAELMTPSPMP